MELGNKINTLLWEKQNKKRYCKSHKKPNSRSVTSQKQPPPITISVLNSHNKASFVDNDFIDWSQNTASILPPFIILYPNHKTKACQKSLKTTNHQKTLQKNPKTRKICYF